MIGKRVIVRGNNSGVFYGTLDSRVGQEVKLLNCRRVWKWDGAASLSQLAVEGVKKPKNCNFTVYVKEIEILDAIEIILCEKLAIANIESVGVWKI